MLKLENMHNHHLVIKPTQKNIFFYMVLMQTTYHLSISLSQMPPNQSLAGMLLLDHDINFFLGGGVFLNWGFGLVGQWQIMHVGDYKRIAVIFVKATAFQLVFNFEQTRTVTMFGEHGIMAHIP